MLKSFLKLRQEIKGEERFIFSGPDLAPEISSETVTCTNDLSWTVLEGDQGTLLAVVESDLPGHEIWL